MIDYIDAIEIVKNNLQDLPVNTEQVELLDSLNRILAEDIKSDISLPQFDNSAMDGIALKFSENIREWRIIAEIYSGNFKDITVDKSNAVYITTGAKLPMGCDTVIPVEDIIFEGNTAVLKANSNIVLGQNIRKCSEYLLAGTKVIEKNTILNSRHLSIAAACGKSSLNVYSQYKIGVFSTGDELVNINTIPSDDKIRCSNLYTILAAIKDLNMIPVNFGFVNDNKENIKDILIKTLNSEIDILITTGGVSAGKYDYLKDIFNELGVSIKFSGVNIQPGKPMVFGTFEVGRRKKLVFGLPGNPVSAFVNFIVFIRNTILMKFDSKSINTVFAKLEHGIKKTDRKRHFIRGNYFNKENDNYVTMTGSQSSANLPGLCKANCLMVVEEDRINPKKGDVVKCMMI